MKATVLARYLILGLLVVLTACSPGMAIMQPTSPAPSPTGLPIQVLSPTQSVPTQAPATATSVPATATLAAPAATSVPLMALQTETSQPNETSIPAAFNCQDAAQYITDDGLDGTTYAPNTAFTKTWMLKNTGSCVWDSHYLISNLSGIPMTQSPGYWLLSQGQTVPPGQTVNITLGMTSPEDKGDDLSAVVGSFPRVRRVQLYATCCVFICSDYAQDTAAPLLSTCIK